MFKTYTLTAFRNILQYKEQAAINISGLANVIAWPIAWFAMNCWLHNFTFRTTIQIWMFLLAGFIVLFIAMLVLCYKIIRAALANPINSLRYE